MYERLGGVEALTRLRDLPEDLLWQEENKEALAAGAKGLKF
jgi:post-segregation antitoxin (ccd killing protein)